MLTQIADLLQPVIVELLFLGLNGIFGAKVTGILAEKNAREALHSAIDTGVDLVMDRVLEAVVRKGRLSSDEEAEFAKDVSIYAKASVPGAMKKLKPDNAVLEALITSRIVTAASAAASALND